MRVRNFKTNDIAKLPQVLSSLTADGFKPTLALVFANINFSQEALQQFFASTGMCFIASSAAGEFINGELDDPAIVGLLMEMDPANYASFFLPFNGDGYTKAGRELGRFSTEHFAQPAIIVLTSGIPDGESLIKHIEEGAGTTVPLFGGIASDDFKMQQTFVYSAEGITNSGIAAIVIDRSRVEMEGLVFGGWYPVGITRTITKSKGNVVYTIDNEPALDLIARFCHKAPEEFTAGPDAIKNLTTHFQLLIYREDSYPVLRTAIAADLESRSLTFTSMMPEGVKMKFSLTPSFEVMDNLVTKYNELKNNCDEPEAVVLFSCKGRQMIFGPWIANEVSRISEIWKAPLTGFLSYGEIGKTSQESVEFHNMACSVLLMKEK